MLSVKLKEGMYRGVLTLNVEKQIELPFNFEVKYEKKKPRILIRNADERIMVDEISFNGDSVNFKMPVFDTEFRTVLKDGNLEGLWINHYKTINNRIKFKAVYGEPRRFLFPVSQGGTPFEGRWESTFSPGTKDSSKAVGLFHHQEQTNVVTGTFLTETGDYRYLDGMQSGNMLYLSSFDGGRAYLFTAELKDGELKGIFYSGLTWIEPWAAKQNKNFQLADAEELTYVKNKDKKIEFSFPDTDKKMVALSDQRFENKVVIIQIMGSWCPNCMDESVYLSELYKQYKKDGLEIVALAFEKTPDLDRSSRVLSRMKERLKIEYPVLITQKTGSEKAGEVLPALNKIMAFPTTLFLNRRHEVVSVHTGYSGPATGNEYEVFKQKTEGRIKNLLRE